MDQLKQPFAFHFLNFPCNGVASLMEDDINGKRHDLEDFHLVRTHLGGGGVKPPIHFHCVLHARGWVGPDSM